MMFRTRDWRRHHIERIKRKRRRIWQDYPFADARVAGIVTTTPCRCSCVFCGNPRRWWGEPTVQERRAEEFDDQLLVASGALARLIDEARGVLDSSDIDWERILLYEL